MPSPVRKNRYESEPTTGRIDVLAYRISEAAARQVETKVGIAGLWDLIKWDVEGLVHEHITKHGVYSPKDVVNSDWWKYAAAFLDASRKKGNM